jgi:hypothetical protein
MFQDLTIQIFLTIYHGQLIATFFYDYIIRNSVRLFIDKLEWNIVLNIALGVFFIAAIIWAILSVWGKIKRNLIICTIFLLVIFIIRLVIGVMDIIEKKRAYDRRSYNMELAVFIAQMVVHGFGIVATYVLSTKAA